MPDLVQGEGEEEGKDKKGQASKWLPLLTAINRVNTKLDGAGILSTDDGYTHIFIENHFTYTEEYMLIFDCCSKAAETSL